jgi:hypothetical protein
VRNMWELKASNKNRSQKKYNLILVNIWCSKIIVARNCLL